MNLKKMEEYLRVNLLGPGPRLMKKRIYWAVVSQRFEKHWYILLWDPYLLAQLCSAIVWQILVFLFLFLLGDQTQCILITHILHLCSFTIPDRTFRETLRILFETFLVAPLHEGFHFITHVATSRSVRHASQKKFDDADCEIEAGV